jgi:pSer/pThr/pTyr-binding forkhead associated (FHA) protein
MEVTMFATTKLHMRLEHQHKLIGELSSDDITGEVMIGRSREAKLVIPSEDRAASSKHAVLKKKMGSILIVDAGSRNGLFFAGERITERKLCPGDCIKIGECELIVSSGAPQKAGKGQIAAAAHGSHRLECLTGVMKGDFINLERQTVRVGSDPDSELPLSDSLISRRHAELTLDEKGECWVNDLKSANGTFVNRIPLSGKKRMLKDGDIVSFAFMDFRFLDKAVKHTRSYFWVKIASVGATLVAGAIFYFAYLVGTSSAPDLIKLAKGYAGQERFSEARTFLESAQNARQFEQYRLERDALMDQLNTWEKTSNDWNSVKKNIKAKEWAAAVRMLGSMQYDRMENWNWNELTAIKCKNQAAKVKEYLDAFLKIQASLKNAEQSVDTLRGMQQELAKVIEQMETTPEELYTPLLEASRKVLETLTSNLTNLDGMNSALAQLEQLYPNFKLIVAELSDVEQKSTGTVKVMAGRYLIPIRKMQALQDQLLRNATALAALKFEQIVPVVDLPTVDECAINPYINSQRKNIENIDKNFQVASQQIQLLLSVFKKSNIEIFKTPRLIQLFSEEEMWGDVFGCDVLKRKIPKRNRAEPEGAYDRVLGIEYFYELLRALPEKYDDSALESMAFHPECVQIRTLFRQFVDFSNFVTLPQNKWLLRGEIQKMHLYCQEQVANREKIITSLFEGGGAEPLSRRSLIGRALAIHLAPDGRFSREVCEKVADDFKKFRLPLVLLNNEYDSATPERGIQLRTQIMAKGIPGDPIVRRMWATLQE